MSESPLVTIDHFEGLLNEDFALGGDNEGEKLRLVEISPLRKAYPEQPRNPFVLLFRGSRKKALTQGTYSLGHARAGSMDIFLVPVGVEEEGFLYEATFN